jgi:hypothetical protein
MFTPVSTLYLNEFGLVACTLTSVSRPRGHTRVPVCVHTAGCTHAVYTMVSTRSNRKVCTLEYLGYPLGLVRARIFAIESASFRLKQASSRVSLLREGPFPRGAPSVPPFSPSFS